MPLDAVVSVALLAQNVVSSPFPVLKEFVPFISEVGYLNLKCLYHFLTVWCRERNLISAEFLL